MSADWIVKLSSARGSRATDRRGCLRRSCVTRTNSIYILRIYYMYTHVSYSSWLGAEGSRDVTHAHVKAAAGDRGEHACNEEATRPRAVSIPHVGRMDNERGGSSFLRRQLPTVQGGPDFKTDADRAGEPPTTCNDNKKDADLVPGAWELESPAGCCRRKPRRRAWKPGSA